MEKLNNIFFLDKASEELCKITKNWSHKDKFQKWLFDRLAQLDDNNNVHLDYPRWFESIDELYAITYRHREKNIRILYCIENDITKILLCSFDEKNTKGDYTKAKTNARQRLKLFKEGAIHEEE